MTNLPAYARLCARATPESLRRNPVTAPHIHTFFRLAKQHGLPIARTWLLGALIFDNNPDLHTPETTTTSRHTSANPHSTYNHSSNRQLARLQQHIETASIETLHDDAHPTSI